MKVAIAGVWHETNTLTKSKTTKDNFLNFGWYQGNQLLNAFLKTKTVMGGYIDVLSENQVDIIPLFGAYATPSGIITKETFNEIVNNLIESIRSNLLVSGLLLELHGAQVVEDLADPEAIIVQKVREAIGDVPIAVVTDFHANMTEARLGPVDIWTGYRTNPHIDTYETGRRSADALIELIQNQNKVEMSLKAAELIYSPIAQSTKDLPFKLFLQKAKELKQKYDLFDLIVHGGYSFANVEQAGVSFTAVGPEGSLLNRQSALEEITSFAQFHKSEITQEIIEIDQLLEIIEQQKTGRIAIADIADNINGGSAGDSTHVLKALLSTNRKLLTSICDPAAVKALSEKQVGSTAQVSLGGWSDPLVGEPILFEGEIEFLGEGKYTHSGPMYTGQSFSMGQVAVISSSNAKILIQTLPQQPNDLSIFESFGLDPAAFELILLKGAIALRATWPPLVDLFLNASSLGTTDCNLERLKLDKLKGKVWPLS